MASYFIRNSSRVVKDVPAEASESSRRFFIDSFARDNTVGEDFEHHPEGSKQQLMPYYAMPENDPRHVRFHQHRLDQRLQGRIKEERKRKAEAREAAIKRTAGRARRRSSAAAASAATQQPLVTSTTSHHKGVEDATAPSSDSDSPSRPSPRRRSSLGPVTQEEVMRAHIDVRFPALAQRHTQRHVSPSKVAGTQSGKPQFIATLPSLSTRRRGGGGGAAASARQLEAARQLQPSAGVLTGRTVANNDQRGALRLLETYAVAVGGHSSEWAGQRQLLHPPDVPDGSSTLLDASLQASKDGASDPVTSAQSEAAWLGALRSDGSSSPRANLRVPVAPPLDPTVRTEHTAPPGLASRTGGSHSRDVLMAKAQQQRIMELSSPSVVPLSSSTVAAATNLDASTEGMGKSVTFDVTREARERAAHLAEHAPDAGARKSLVSREDTSRAMAQAMQDQAVALARVFQAKLRSQHDYFVALLRTHASESATDERLKQLARLGVALEQEEERGDALLDDLNRAESHVAAQDGEIARLAGLVASLKDEVATKSAEIRNMVEARALCSNAIAQTQVTMETMSEQEALLRTVSEELVRVSAGPTPRRMGTMTASTLVAHASVRMQGSIDAFVPTPKAPDGGPPDGRGRPAPLEGLALDTSMQLGESGATSTAKAAGSPQLLRRGSVIRPEMVMADPDASGDAASLGMVVSMGAAGGITDDVLRRGAREIETVNMAIQTILEMGDFAAADDDGASSSAATPTPLGTASAADRPLIVHPPDASPPIASSYTLVPPPLLVIEVPNAGNDDGLPTSRSQQDSLLPSPTNGQRGNDAPPPALGVVPPGSDEDTGDEDSSTSDQAVTNSAPLSPAEDPRARDGVIVAASEDDDSEDGVDRLQRLEDEAAAAAAEQQRQRKEAMRSALEEAENDALRKSGDSLTSPTHSEGAAPVDTTKSGTRKKRSGGTSSGPSSALLSPKMEAAKSGATSRRPSFNPGSKLQSPPGGGRKPSFQPPAAGATLGMPPGQSPRRLSNLHAPTAAALARDSATRVEEAVARMKKKSIAASRIAISRTVNPAAGSVVAAPPPTGSVGIVAISNFSEDSKTLSMLTSWMTDEAHTGGTPITPIFFDGVTCVLAFATPAKALDFALHQMNMSRLAFAFDVLHIDTSFVVGPFACYDSAIARGMQNLVSFSARGEIIVPAPVYKSYVTPINDVLVVMRLEVSFHASLDEADLFSIHKEGVSLIDRGVACYDPMKPIVFGGLGDAESGEDTPRQLALGGAASSRMVRRRGPLSMRASAPAFGYPHGAVAQGRNNGRSPQTAPLGASGFSAFGSDSTVEKRHMLVVYSNEKHPDIADSRACTSVGVQKALQTVEVASGLDTVATTVHSTQTISVRTRTLATGPGDSQLAIAPIGDKTDEFSDDSDGGARSPHRTPRAAGKQAGIPLALKLKQRLTELFSCPVCSTLLTDARIFVPCGHIFCKKCVDTRMKIVPQDEFDDVVEFRCRTCRQVSFDVPTPCLPIDAAVKELRRRNAFSDDGSPA